MIESWTVETILENARQYKTRQLFMKGNPPAYKALLKIGKINLLDNLWTRKRIEYTDEILLEMAKKYTRPHEWEKDDRNSYTAACTRKNLWEQIKASWPPIEKTIKVKKEKQSPEEIYQKSLDKAKAKFELYGITVLKVFTQDNRQYGLFTDGIETWENRTDHELRHRTK